MIAGLARLKLFAVLAAALLAACTPEPPKCGAPETKALALQILTGQIGRGLRYMHEVNPEQLRQALDIDLAAALSYDKDVGRLVCRGTLKVFGENYTTIEYTSQASDDGRHLVTAGGIQDGDVRGIAIRFAARDEDAKQAKIAEAKAKAAAAPAPPAKPSFPCDGSVSPVEQTICETPVLARLDIAMARNVLASLEARMDEDAKKSMTEKQQAFFAERDQCTDVACVESAYRQRIDKVCTERTDVVPVCVTSDTIR